MMEGKDNLRKLITKKTYRFPLIDGRTYRVDCIKYFIFFTILYFFS